MPATSRRDRELLTYFSDLVYCNPFHPQRMACERAVLGKRYVAEEDLAWSRTMQWREADRTNVLTLTEEANRLVNQVRENLLQGADCETSLAQHYEDAVTYVLYYRYFASLINTREPADLKNVRKTWVQFQADFSHFFDLPGRPPLNIHTPEHTFACLDQVRRAFRHIFHFLLGESGPAIRLRGEIWQSIFTHDMRRYRRSLFQRMPDLATLITGPSGTGKELVATAIGLSQYIPFDAARVTFSGQIQDAFIPLNLSALSPTLIESELFGHRKGAFTGAISDRNGWLEQCPAHGAVFLDEIGELDLAIQVKLLRVVQARAFSRLGETSERPFLGKLITATNRDLAYEMESGKFHRDLYYRLCSDHIQTPSLREQLQDRPQALSGLIQMLAERIAGEEAAALAEEVEHWIQTHLPADYPWPGNVRELEQCVRNIMVRQRYVPPQTNIPSQPLSTSPAWFEQIKNRQLTADELINAYVTWVYAHEPTYEAVAKIVQLDRRTVKVRIDPHLLKLFQTWET